MYCYGLLYPTASHWIKGIFQVKYSGWQLPGVSFFYRFPKILLTIIESGTTVYHFAFSYDTVFECKKEAIS